MHRRIERRYWAFSAVSSVITIFVALGAAYAAYKAYIATDSQARTARRQLEQEEEPSVQVTGLRVAEVHEAGNEGQIHIDPIVRNDGSLPARNMRAQGWSAFCDKERIPGGFFPASNISTDGAPISLGGKQETSIVIRHQIIQERQKRLRDGSLRAFFFGTITYDRMMAPGDIGGQHITRYCFAMTGLPPKEKIGGLEPLTDIYLCGSKTNCSDDTCDIVPSDRTSCHETLPTPLNE